jgi:hypothetical protein
MPNFWRPAYRRIAAGGVLLILPLLLAACPSTGAATGNTLHVSLVDNFNGNIGGGPLGVTGTAVDKLEGDLAEGGPGTWRGTLQGSTDRTVETTVLTQNCKTNIVGTQEVDVVGVQGTFGDMNFKLQFTPKSAPNYTAPDTCQSGPPTKASNGIEWLDFNNQAYLDGMTVNLPVKPGGTWTTGQGQGQQPDDPCTALAPLLGCQWTRRLTVQYGGANPS